jgi:hypothetical protein
MLVDQIVEAAVRGFEKALEEKRARIWQPFWRRSLLKP